MQKSGCRHYGIKFLTSSWSKDIEVLIASIAAAQKMGAGEELLNHL